MSKLPIPREVLAQHVAILGKTRSGKSSVMRLLVEDLLERKQPVCIVDPKGDWYGIKLAADGKNPGYPVVVFGGEHADIPIGEGSGPRVADLFATGNRPCLIDLGGWMVGARTRFWIDFASTLFRHTKGTRWLAIDEVHNFAPKGSLKGTEGEMAKALHWANRLASEGLGKGLALVFASQRPQKVHNDTLTSAETLIAMRVLHPSDRGAVSEWIKGCGDSEGSEVLGSLAKMARGEGWAWSPEIGFGPKRVKFPLFQTYDSFRPQTLDDARRLTGWAEIGGIDEVRKKFEAEIERAKQEDPKELRRQLAERDRRIREFERGAAVQSAKTVETRIEMPVLPPAMGKRLEASAKAIAGAGEKLGAAVGQLATISREILAGLAKIGGNGQRRPVPAVRGFPGSQETRRAPVLISRPEIRRENRHRPAAPAEGLTRTEQRVLDALAWWEFLGIERPTKVQVGMIAGYRVGKAVGGTYGNILGTLRSAGLIDYPMPALTALTDAGRAVARVPDIDPTPAGIQAAVFQRLSATEQRVLQVLIDAYPDALSKQETGSRASYAVGPAVGGTFGNILGRLRTLQLVDYPSPGQVVACPVLFLEGARR